MEPSKKSEAVENLFTELTGVDRRAEIKADRCTFCKQPATEFTDELSRKEYTISGLCQKCQDSVFSGSDD